MSIKNKGYYGKLAAETENPDFLFNQNMQRISELRVPDTACLLDRLVDLLHHDQQMMKVIEAFLDDAEELHKYTFSVEQLNEMQALAEKVTKLPTLWTNSYFVSTVGGAPLAVIKQYVENQKHV